MHGHAFYSEPYSDGGKQLEDGRSLADETRAKGVNSLAIVATLLAIGENITAQVGATKSTYRYNNHSHIGTTDDDDDADDDHITSTHRHGLHIGRLDRYVVKGGVNGG